MLELTESEYGFISEVAHDENAAPYLVIHSITNIAWSEETLALYMKHFGSKMEFHNMNTLFGHVVVSEKPVISNDPANDAKSGGLPVGHPPLNAYMGVPVFYDGKLVGMYSIANRKNGYDEEMLEFLKPFNATYGAILNAKKLAESKKEILKELKISKEMAEKASQAKSQFLSSMSHELRTPLNAILGFGQLLEMEIGQRLSDTQRDNVQEILKAGSHLLSLINEVLDLSKIEAGNIDLHIEQVSVNEVLAQSMSTIATLANKKDVETSVVYEPVDGQDAGVEEPEYLVDADRMRLKQIFLNLLSNAVKYNRDGGKVLVTVSLTNKQKVKISFADTGVGIPDNKKNEVFQSFSRLGMEDTETEGSGIGLVITRQLVEKQEGNIGFKSKAGVGTEFWIELPAWSGMVIDKNESVEEESIEVNVDKNKTLLYIEDNPANLRLVSQIVSAMDHLDLLTAHEPLLGMEMVYHHQPDLVLLDINLPYMDGYEVFRKLNEDEVTRDIPVVAISANAMPADVDKCMEMGFVEYVTKPIDVVSFLDVLKKYLSEE